MSELTDGKLEWCHTHHTSSGGRYSYRELAEMYGLSSSEAMRGRLRRYRRRRDPNALPPEQPPADYTMDDPAPTSFTEEGNYAKASAHGPHIKTLDELIVACNVDLDTWQPIRPTFKVWDGYAKKERADLQFDDGRITGHMRKEGLEAISLYSVACTFRRKDPIPVHPTIVPAAPIPTEPPAPPKPTPAKVMRTALFCDAHIGFVRDRFGKLTPLHDNRALDVALQIAVCANVHRVDVLGDWGDWTESSDRYVRGPEYAGVTQPSVFAAHFWLDRIRAALPNAAITLHQGNHEKRWKTAMASHLAWAYGLRKGDEPEAPPALSIQNVLALKAIGVQWVDGYPDDDDWISPRVHLQHGPKAQAPGNTAKAMAMTSLALEAFGHIHRRELQARTVYLRDGSQVVDAFSPGCLCHIDGRVPGRTTKQQWQQGFALLDYEPEHTGYNISLIPIEQGRALYDGHVYESRPTLPDLQAMYPDWELGTEI